jgi:endonuclease-3
MVAPMDRKPHAPGAARAASLIFVIETLAELYPLGEPPTDPLEMILWENMGYLIDDERRAELFAEFIERVGLHPKKIVNASPETLLDIAERGGMRPETRVERWLETAHLALKDRGGDLAATLAALPPKKARGLLKQFPTIADPGADKILLFSGIAVQPALDSNGLRVLARLGFSAERSSYGASYKEAVQVLAAEGRPDRDWLMGAYHALREHGRTLCKRSVPICVACPLDPVCAHVEVGAL